MSRVELREWDSSDLPAVWYWLQSYPDFILHDYGPLTLKAFIDQESKRESTNFSIYVGDILFGLLICDQISPILCEAHAYFRRGIEVWDAMKALRLGIAWAWRQGYQKITSPVFAQNKPMIAILKRLGAVEEGYFRGHTRQHGKPVDVIYFSIFKEV